MYKSLKKYSVDKGKIDNNWIVVLYCIILKQNKHTQLST